MLYGYVAMLFGSSLSLYQPPPTTRVAHSQPTNVTYSRWKRKMLMVKNAAHNATEMNVVDASVDDACGEKPA